MQCAKICVPMYFKWLTCWLTTTLKCFWIVIMSFKCHDRSWQIIPLVLLRVLRFTNLWTKPSTVIDVLGGVLWNKCVCLCAQLTTGHRVALSTIGYVGCSISIFCLAITLVTFAVLSWVSLSSLRLVHVFVNIPYFSCKPLLLITWFRSH